MNGGARATLGIAATLFLAAIMPLLAVAGALILTGMALHSIMSAGTTMPTTQQQQQLDHEIELEIKEARRLLGYDHD